jgi:Cu/Ag efflux protein CusF
MKKWKIISLAVAAHLVVASAGTGFVAEFARRKVKKLDEKAKKVTIIHEKLKCIDMPAMTMVFKIGGASMPPS